MDYAQIWEMCRNDPDPIRVIQRVTGWNQSMAAMQYQRFKKMYLPDDDRDSNQDGSVRKTSWTAEEIAIVKDNSLTIQQMCEKTGRTYQSVLTKRKKLNHGISTTPVIRKNFCEGHEDVLGDESLTNSEVMKRTGLSAPQVCAWRKNHGISGREIQHKRCLDRLKSIPMDEMKSIDVNNLIAATARSERRLKPIMYSGSVCEFVRMKDEVLTFEYNLSTFSVEWDKLHGLIEDLKEAEAIHNEA